MRDIVCLAENLDEKRRECQIGTISTVPVNTHLQNKTPYYTSRLVPQFKTTTLSAMNLDAEALERSDSDERFAPPESDMEDEVDGEVPSDVTEIVQGKKRDRGENAPPIFDANTEPLDDDGIRSESPTANSGSHERATLSIKNTTELFAGLHDKIRCHIDEGCDIMTFKRRADLIKLLDDGVCTQMRRLNRVVRHVMQKAKNDTALPEAFRKSLEFLHLYPCGESEVEPCIDQLSMSRRGHYWQITLRIAKEELRRSKFVEVCAKHDDEMEAQTEFDTYCADLEKDAPTIAAVYIVGQDAVIQHAGRETCTTRVGRHLQIASATGVQSVVTFQLEGVEQFRLYLLMHSVSRWTECPKMLQRDIKEFVFALYILMGRYNIDTL